MKKTILAAFCAAMLAGAAQPAEMNFPSDEPIAAITIPDEWKPTETESGIEATSSDQAVYLSIDVADEKTSDKVIEDAIDFLDKNGVKIDETTMKKEKLDINGMETSTLEWAGTDESGDVTIGLAFLSPKPGRLLVVTYWGTKGEEEKHQVELGTMLMSLKPSEG